MQLFRGVQVQNERTCVSSFWALSSQYFPFRECAMQTSSAEVLQQEPAWKYTKKALKCLLTVAVGFVLC